MIEYVQTFRVRALWAGSMKMLKCIYINKIHVISMGQKMCKLNVVAVPLQVFVLWRIRLYIA